MRRRPLDPAELKPSEQAPERAEKPGTQALLDAVDEMRGSGSFDWADDTLRDIYDWVAERRFFTEGQLRAVNNIRAGRKWGEVEL